MFTTRYLLVGNIWESACQPIVSRKFANMIGVNGKHLVIMGMKKRLLEIFGTSKTYRSPIIIQCGQLLLRVPRSHHVIPSILARYLYKIIFSYNHLSGLLLGNTPPSEKKMAHMILWYGPYNMGVKLITRLFTLNFRSKTKYIILCRLKQIQQVFVLLISLKVYD